MRILSISAPSNHSGKTLLACRIAARWPGALQAAKVSTIYRDGNCPRDSATHACACRQLHGDAYHVITDRGVLGQPGTDTGELLAAGAEPVLWGLARPGAHAELWEHLARFLLPDRPLVTEGGQIARLVEPAALIYVVNPTTRERWKKSVPEFLERADLVVVNPFADGRFLGETPDALMLLGELGDRGVLYDVSRPAAEWPTPLARTVSAALRV